MMVELEAYIKLLAGLLPVVDPIGAIPLFIEKIVVMLSPYPAGLQGIRR